MQGSVEVVERLQASMPAARVCVSSAMRVCVGKGVGCVELEVCGGSQRARKGKERPLNGAPVKRNRLFTPMKLSSGKYVCGGAGECPVPRNHTNAVANERVTDVSSCPTKQRNPNHNRVARGQKNEPNARTSVQTQRVENKNV